MPVANITIIETPTPMIEDWEPPTSTNTELTRELPSIADIVTTIQGRKFYFCAEGCRDAFVADPDKYLNSVPAKKKGLWGRYLERLEKATAGKSMNCH